jgi:hypothetical protein
VGFMGLVGGDIVDPSLDGIYKDWGKKSSFIIRASYNYFWFTQAIFFFVASINPSTLRLSNSKSGLAQI